MKQIILTTDFSENARYAADYAIRLFGTKNVQYTLLNCYLEPGGVNVVVSLTEFMREESERGLEREKEYLLELFGNNLPLKSHSHYGNLVAVVKKMQEEEQYDYIVLGTHSRSKLEEWFMGSTATNAIKHLDMPLLLVPINAANRNPKKIAFAADYAQMKNMSKLQPLVNLVAGLKGELQIVHVGKSSEASYHEAVEGFGIHGILENVKHSFHQMAESDPVMGIHLFMVREKSDLLAVVARNRSFWENMFHRSVSQELSKHLETPMLVVHD